MLGIKLFASRIDAAVMVNLSSPTMNLLECVSYGMMKALSELCICTASSCNEFPCRVKMVRYIDAREEPRGA